MKEFELFKDFTSSLFKIYESDKIGFWEISMQNFLSYFSKPRLIYKRSKNIFLLKQLFGSLEKETISFIEIIDRKWNTKINEMKSARKQYIQDAFPVFIMLAIWVKEIGLHEVIEKYDQVIKAGIYAVIGYSILDDNLDSNKPSPSEILVSHLFLSEYEQICYSIFGYTKIQHDIFHRIRLLFLESEIKEKKSRWIQSPYDDRKPIDLGIKGLNAVAPFMLCLEKAGKIEFIEKYLDSFLLIGAVIQMIDDWEDLDNDLEIGHYSYVTLGWKDYSQGTKVISSTLKNDRTRILKTLDECNAMIEKARKLLMEVNDNIIMQLLIVTENRMKGFYKKNFSISMN